MTKVFLCVFALSISLVANESQDITKRAIVKLIERNSFLENRLNQLEQRVNALEILKKNNFNVNREKKENVVSKIIDINKKNFFFIPRGKSFVRNEPNPNAPILSIATHKNIYKINAFKCYRNVKGFWGKIQEGWIYMSNPLYGSIVNEKMEKMNLAYSRWCK